MSNLLLGNGFKFDAIYIISLCYIFVLITVSFIAVLLLIGRSIGKYAERNGHNRKTWTVLGFFFGLIALLALHIAIVAERNGHNFALWGMLGFFFGVYALVSLQTGLVAERKGFDFSSYCIIGSVFGLSGLFVTCFLPTAQSKNVALNQDTTNDNNND